MMWNKVLVVSVILLSLDYGRTEHSKLILMNDNYLLLTQ